MADTQVLRRLLEEKIAALTVQLQEAEADLKAIERIEKIDTELNTKTMSTPSPAAKPAWAGKPTPPSI